MNKLAKERKRGQVTGPQLFSVYKSREENRRMVQRPLN